MEVNNIKLSSRASDASSGGTELAEQVFSSGNSAKGAESAASTPPLVVRNNSHPHESSEPIEKAGSPSNQARTPAVRAKTSAKVGIPVTRTKEPVSIPTGIIDSPSHNHCLSNYWILTEKANKVTNIGRKVNQREGEGNKRG